MFKLNGYPFGKYYYLITNERLKDDTVLDPLIYFTIHKIICSLVSFGNPLRNFIL